MYATPIAKLMRFSLVLISFFLVAAVARAADSPYPLQILQPAAGLSTTNRFYKAYPGLPYNVRAAVVGGAYPYKFALTTAPSGMTINADTGVINWSAPVAQSTPYSVSMMVTDSEGNVRSVNWTIQVTTNRFLFVDAVNGRAGATGTINDPMRTFADVYGGTAYENKWSTVRRDYFVYFKSGTYYMDGYTGGTTTVQYTNNQPLVLLAYPNSRPVLDMSRAFLNADSPLNNFYFEGFEVTNMSTPERFGLRLTGSSSNVTIRNNIFHNIPASTGSNNQSALMMTRDSNGTRWSIQDNQFYDIHHGYGIIGYSTSYVLVEDNLLYNIDDPSGGSSHPIGPKIGTTYWFIRHNKLYDVGSYGIWLYYQPDSNTGGYGNMEVSYNYVKMRSSGGEALAVNSSLSSNVGPSYIFRNTFVGNVTFSNISSTTGPFYFAKNVVIDETPVSGGVQCDGCSSASQISQLNNLVGTSSNNIVDANGLLTSGYQSYLGVRGWQLGSGSSVVISPPSAPVLSVQ